tara:strand:- start:172 stop:648 length:477 start_codon:yes stop_codon:yes gene_type:complete
VVEEVLKQPKRFKQLFDCYLSDDELVRLRTSNAMKCVARENTALLVPYLDAMLDDISKIPQPLVRWTPAQLFVLLTEHMSKPQLVRAKKILKRNLASGSDWTVLTQTMVTLTDWSESDPVLRRWLKPVLEKLCDDERKSVSSKAQKSLTKVTKGLKKK